MSGEDKMINENLLSGVCCKTSPPFSMKSSVKSIMCIDILRNRFLFWV